MPLYVRAGAVLPLGPVKQYTDEAVEEPLTFAVYPGADGASALYEDDGRTFRYRSGEWMGIGTAWNDKTRVLSLQLQDGSRMLPPLQRRLAARLAGETRPRQVVFEGRPLSVHF
jgi:alpha-glucosidase (family GH31 glycosyl hydrolase)